MIIIAPGLYFLWAIATTRRFSAKVGAKRIPPVEHGMIVLDGTPAAFRWDTMQVLQTITRNSTTGQMLYAYTLTGRTARRSAHGFYDHVRILGADHSSSRSPTLSSSQALAAGRCSRRPDAVGARIATAKRGMVSWQDIEKIDVRDGVVVLKKAARRVRGRRPGLQIPNWFLFLAVARHYLG